MCGCTNLSHSHRLLALLIDNFLHCTTHRLCELVKLQSSCKKLNLLSELMDHSGDYVHTVLPYILSLLQRGLDQRVLLLTHSLSPDPEVGRFTPQAEYARQIWFLHWS